jgi:GNAT superfamily N-acetyltransferase
MRSSMHPRLAVVRKSALDRTSDRAVRIRIARPSDARQIAALCSQLGYPCSRDEIIKRLKVLSRDVEHSVYVAEAPRGTVLGCIHAGVEKRVESDPFVEIGALVVEARGRGSGIGTLLLEQAENWARGRRLNSIRLRSNTIRKEAHKFYLKMGYEITKTQYAFQKTL